MRSWDIVWSDADSELPELDSLRMRAYDLCRNNPMALGAINRWVDNTIGTGLELQCRVDRKTLGLDDEQADDWEEMVEGRFRAWAEDHNEADVERKQNFYDLQGLMYRTELIAGDALCHFPHVSRRHSMFRMRTQIIDPARLRNEYNEPDTSRLAGGVQRDRFGAPMLYHVMKTHPNSSKLDEATFEWAKIRAFGNLSPRQNVVHLLCETRPGQSRGVPLLAPIMTKLKQLDRFTEAEIMAAVINSFFSVFIKNSEGGELDYGDGEGDEHEQTLSEVALGSGNVLELGDGQDIQVADAKRPNNAVSEFFTALYQQMGSGIGIPPEIWRQMFSTSYSAARGAFLEFGRGIMRSRKHTGLHYCAPTYKNWLSDEIARGHIAAPGYFKDPVRRAAWCGHAWIGPPRGQVDPTKETQAEDNMYRMRVKPLSDITTQLTGGDWNTTIHRIAREQRLMERLDVSREELVAESTVNIDESGEPQKPGNPAEE